MHICKFQYGFGKKKEKFFMDAPLARGLTGLCPWTHLRREGSEGSKGSKGSEGGGIALSGDEFYKPPAAVTSA